MKVSETEYYYFYFRKNLLKNTYTYLGSEKTEKPVQNDESNYVLPNPQKNVQKTVVESFISHLYQEKTETQTQKITKILKRTFPDGN